MNYVITKGAELLGRPDTTMDCTKDGKCSGCGQCCSNYLPVSDREIKTIRRYIKKNNITPARHVIAPVSAKPIDMICPFRDEEKGICTIYEVRPLICKAFQCNLGPVEVLQEVSKHKPEKRTGVNVKATFFGLFDEAEMEATKIMEFRAKRGGAKLFEELKEGI